MKLVKVIWLVLGPVWASAQIVVSGNAFIAGSDVVTNLGLRNLSNTSDLSKLSLVLVGNTAGQSVVNTTNVPTAIDKLTINSDVNFGLEGQWNITNQLNLTKGNLVPARGTFDKLIYSGSNDLTGSDASYVQGPLYITKSTGLRTWPIGDQNGFAPVVLQGIDAADVNAEIGFDVVSAAPFGTPTLPVKEIFQDRFWQIFINNPNSSTGEYAGSIISVSKNGTDSFFAAGGDPLILERDAADNDNNLGGADDVLFATSTTKTSSNGRYYGIARSEKTTVVVHRLITPNDEDDLNNVLYIRGIDSYPNNTVTMLDRWGVAVKEWANFVNYPIGSGAETSNFNFKRLAVGNYIVVVKYSTGGKEQSVSQMISVLK